MKKFLSITMALLAALSLAMVVSCGDGGGGGGGGDTTYFDVTFNANTTDTVQGLPDGGKINAAEGSSITLPTLSGRSGYIFKGWADSATATAIGDGLTGGASYTVTAETALWAVWAAGYTITFHQNNDYATWALATDEVYVQEYESGATYAAPASNPMGISGYTFIGWSATETDMFESEPTAGTDYTLWTAPTTVSANATVYGVWWVDYAEGDFVEVTFDISGAPAGSTITKGKAVVPEFGTLGATALEVADIEGYYFAGWYLDPTNLTTKAIAGTTQVEDQDVEYIGVWTPIDFIHAENGGFAVYKFVIPTATTDDPTPSLGDYTKIVASYKIAREGDLAKNQRSRVMGPYLSTGTSLADARDEGNATALPANVGDFELFFTRISTSTIRASVAADNYNAGGTGTAANIVGGDNTAYTKVHGWDATNSRFDPNAPFIMSNGFAGGGTYAANNYSTTDYKTLEYPSTGDGHGSYTGVVWTDAVAAGDGAVLYFAVGLSNADGTDIRYYAQDIYLSNAEGTKILRTLGNVEGGKTLSIAYFDAELMNNAVTEFPTAPVVVDPVAPAVAYPENVPANKTFALPAFNWIGGDATHQVGWAIDPNNDDGANPLTITGLTVAHFAWAKELRISISKQLTASSATLVYKHDESGWNNGANVVNNGTINADNGGSYVTVPGATEDDPATYILVIDLTKAFGSNAKWNDYMVSDEAIGLMLQYWNEPTDEIITSAELVLFDETYFDD